MNRPPESGIMTSSGADRSVRVRFIHGVGDMAPDERNGAFSLGAIALTSGVK